MWELGYLFSGSLLKKARQLTDDARLENGEKADQLFQQAYSRFAAISPSYSNYADSLYYWGFSLLNQAQSQSSTAAINTFEQAIEKFSLCKAVAPDHLGAANDGGVALLALAKAKQVNLDDELYQKAEASFQSAENIQSGSASYNLACLYALHKDNDGCLKALNKAKDHGLIPDQQAMLDDEDLLNIKNQAWFTDYIHSLTEVETESETANEEDSVSDNAASIDKQDD